MLHVLRSAQLLHCTPQAAWDFIATPDNLARITPPYMGFEVLGQTAGVMYAGQLIEYYVRPVLGIRLHWVTEITHVTPGRFFVDEQRFGPYAFWHHQHRLEPADEGVLMTDEVHYKLPFGPLGRAANALFVKRQLNGIFAFRIKVLNDLFNGSGKIIGETQRVP
ncbi:SRPBCC family protein [Hufsiella ginkgonis]|uniref:Cell division inhibitor n=1 Tax=Hufsiella ginkgonis TaxID=2695274 RepID=A0A7K1XU23_9SPHI|nr:SRPBCC family protein [Hufsiella ginkgonis]MXV14297.1 hypothetical protein [Hufsiella ginkgonis]